VGIIERDLSRDAFSEILRSNLQILEHFHNYQKLSTAGYWWFSVLGESYPKKFTRQTRDFGAVVINSYQISFFVWTQWRESGKCQVFEMT